MTYDDPVVIACGILIAVVILANLLNWGDWIFYRRKLRRNTFQRRARR